MSLGMGGPNGNNSAAGQQQQQQQQQMSAMYVSDQFAIRYGYVMPVRQLGFKMLPEVLALLQGECSVVGTGSNAKLLLPAPGARNTFNEVGDSPTHSSHSTCQLCTGSAVQQNHRCYSKSKVGS
jgi:hypothetical protein